MRAAWLALAGALVGAGPTGALADGARALWGAPETAALAPAAVLAQARAVLRGPADGAGGTHGLAGARDALLRVLGSGAAAGPDGPLAVSTSGEAWALLGRLHAELGQDREAQAALSRAEALYGDDDSAHLRLGWALLGARAGRLDEAYQHLLRLHERGPVSDLLLRRMGDLQMAQGRLHEAIRSYEAACLSGPRAPSPAVRTTGGGGLFGGAGPGLPGPSVGASGALLGGMSSSSPATRPPSDLARACLALAVAYDRSGQRGRADLVLRRAFLLDVAGRALSVPVADFVPAQDRDYYRSLWLQRRGDACAARAALVSYLAAARAAPPGRAYSGPARSRLETLPAECKEGYSPAR